MLGSAPHFCGPKATSHLAAHFEFCAFTHKNRAHFEFCAFTHKPGRGSATARPRPTAVCKRGHRGKSCLTIQVCDFHGLLVSSILVYSLKNTVKLQKTDKVQFLKKKVKYTEICSAYTHKRHIKCYEILDTCSFFMHRIKDCGIHRQHT